MFSFRLIFLSVLALSFLTSCATPTPYQESGAFGMGYRSFKLDSNKYRVSFKGNRITEREQVETYLIYRAAEVTVEEGFTHFSMVNMNTDRKTEFEPISPAIYGYYMPNAGVFPYYVYGNPNAPRSGTLERTEYEAVAFVNMLNDPPKDGQFFNAREVIKNLDPKIQRPQ
jgi:hypothetical protein